MEYFTYLLGFISFITWFYTEKVELTCRETQNLVSGSYCIFALVRDHYFNVNTSFWCPEKCPEISNFFCPENKNVVCPGLGPRWRKSNILSYKTRTDFRSLKNCQQQKDRHTLIWYPSGCDLSWTKCHNFWCNPRNNLPMPLLWMVLLMLWW